MAGLFGSAFSYLGYVFKVVEKAISLICVVISIGS